MDWIKLSFSDSTDIFRCYPRLPLTANCSGIASEHLSPIEESIIAVEKIVANYPAPYYLCVSGGMDSQAMLYAWIRSGVPFTPVSFTYNEDYNARDLYPLKLFAAKYNLEVQYINIDYFHFLNFEMIDFCKKYICNSPQITAHLKFHEYFQDGTVVHSGSPMTNVVFFNNTHLALYRYKLRSRANLIPYFLIETPELAAAFKDMFLYVTESRKAKTDYSLEDDYSIKATIYKKSGFDVIPSLKLTGFERYKDYYDQFPDIVSRQDRIKYGKYPSRRVFDLKFRYPLFEINKYNERTITTFKDQI
jgi:hypothetical protein